MALKFSYPIGGIPASWSACNTPENETGSPPASSASTCNHAVGTATVEYHLDILHADDDGDGASEHSFGAFDFCPYCGESVTTEARAVADRIHEKWEKFWVWYGEQHGPEELKRARKS